MPEDSNVVAWKTVRLGLMAARRQKNYMWYGRGRDFSKIAITYFRLRLDEDDMCGRNDANRTR